jgi:hypothetical protein
MTHSLTGISGKSVGVLLLAVVALHLLLTVLLSAWAPDEREI